jgi:hypothetical protein
MCCDVITALDLILGRKLHKPCLVEQSHPSVFFQLSIRAPLEMTLRLPTFSFPRNVAVVAMSNVLCFVEKFPMQLHITIRSQKAWQIRIQIVKDRIGVSE